MRFKDLKTGMALWLITALLGSMALAEPLAVPAGTRVQILLPNSTSSQVLASDEPIRAVVQEDVLIQDIRVFEKGAEVQLAVAEARKSGNLGRAGRISLNGGVVYDISGEPRPLNFSHEVRGRSRRAQSITYTVISIPLIMFFVGLITLPVAVNMNGKEATLQGGAVFEALTAAPFEISE
jgi:hypothetical protein